MIEASQVAHILTDHYGIMCELREYVSGLVVMTAGPRIDGYRVATIEPWYVGNDTAWGMDDLRIAPDVETEPLESTYVRDLLPAGLDWQHVQAGDVAGAIAAWIETR